MSKRDLGTWGETKVEQYLKEKGYEILVRGYQTRQGEIDLIAKKPPYLAFVEVKLRKDNQFASAMESVTRAKQKKIILAALSYLMESGMQQELQPRFDVAEVYAPLGEKTVQPEIFYLENAFAAET